MQNQNPFAVLGREAPQVASAFNGLISAVAATGGLDAKTRQLVFIGIKAAQGDASAVAAHIPMAKREGASREEIRDVILTTLPACGVLGITRCLVPALEAYDTAADFHKE